MIHHGASFKKIFTADLNNQELNCLGPIWSENGSFDPNENILKHCYVTFFVFTSGASSRSQIYKKPASTFQNGEMHCYGLKWGKNGLLGSNGKFKYINTYIVTYTLTKQ